MMLLAGILIGLVVGVVAVLLLLTHAIKLPW